MRRYLWRSAVVGGLVALGPAAGLAQDALILNDVFVSASRDPGLVLGPAPLDLQHALAGGGRFAIGLGVAMDRRTGQTAPLPPGATLLAVDPVRPRAFLKRNCDVVADVCDVVAWYFETGTVVRLTTTSYSSGLSFGTNLPQARYAVDADVLVVDQAPARFPLGDLALLPVHATTGAAVGPAIRTRRGSWDVLPDGSRLVIGSKTPWTIGDAAEVDVIDVATGAVIAHAETALERVLWEPTLQAVVGVTPSLATMLAFDIRLQLMGAAQLGAGCSLGVQVSPHTRRIYILRGGGDTYMGPIPSRLLVIDPAAGAVDIDGVDRKAGFRTGACLAMKVLTAPGPPRNLHATVSGHDVSLAWENVGAASGFVLDVGFAPGRTDLQVYLGPDSHTAFANVPSGTYFLRLRGGNEFGGGRPSGEVQVVVP